MSTDFFLDLADNTGDGFRYVLLPVQSYSDIPLRRPITLVRCVVRCRDYISDDAPRCISDDEGFKFFNKKGDELFCNDELLPIDDQHDELQLADLEEDTQILDPPGPPTLDHDTSLLRQWRT